MPVSHVLEKVAQLGLPGEEGTALQGYRAAETMVSWTKVQVAAAADGEEYVVADGRDFEGWVRACSVPPSAGHFA